MIQESSLFFIVFSTFLASSLVLFLKIVLDYFSKRRLFNKLEGPADLPFLGNAHQLETKCLSALRRQLHGWAVLYGGQGHTTTRFWVGMQPFVVIFKANGVEDILHSSKHIDKSHVYSYLHDWLGLGLLTSTGKKWKSRRRLLTPSFHFNILNDFMQVFNEQASILVDKVTESGSQTDDIAVLASRCTLDIICETAMGVKMETQALKNAEYIEAIHEVTQIVQWRQATPWLLSTLLYPMLPTYWKERRCLNYLKAFTRKVIKLRRKEQSDAQNNDSDFTGDYIGGKKRRVAFLTSLLNTPSLDDNDVQEEVDTFMFEGHDTTAAGITWAIHAIGHHPGIQKRLHDEVDQVFGDSDRDCTDEDLKSLPYLELVLKEVLRLHPPVPFIGRTLTQEQQLDGISFPSGTDVVIMVYSIHRDPDQFPSPEEFQPERFEPEQKHDRSTYSYIPFSAGPRNCIGQRFATMEQKVILSWLLRKFTWKSMQSFEGLKPYTALILRPSEPMTIQFRPRVG